MPNKLYDFCRWNCNVTRGRETMTGLARVNTLVEGEQLCRWRCWGALIHHSFTWSWMHRAIIRSCNLSYLKHSAEAKTENSQRSHLIPTDDHPPHTQFGVGAVCSNDLALTCSDGITTSSSDERPLKYSVRVSLWSDLALTVLGLQIWMYEGVLNFN